LTLVPLQNARYTLPRRLEKPGRRLPMKSFATMAGWVACAGGLVLGPSLLAPAARGTAPPEERRDPASEVRAIFEKKCTQCHGAHLPKPKGKFGYVLDLKRLAGNPKLVVPFKPEESQLWELVSDGDMPPKKARAGPLTQKEKETIRAWIAAGARPPSRSTPSINPVNDDSRPQSLDLPFSKRLLGWIGKFHILVVHFPIALLLAAVAGEIWSMWKRRKDPWEAVRFCVLLGAAGAVVAAGLGWLHADVGGFGTGSRQILILALHRWVGTTTAVWAVALAVVSEVDARRGVRSKPFRIMLFIGALLVGAAGHLGGILVHGEDYYEF
jgi:hypothetical protein